MKKDRLIFQNILGHSDAHANLSSRMDSRKDPSVFSYRRPIGLGRFEFRYPLEGGLADWYPLHHEIWKEVGIVALLRKPNPSRYLQEEPSASVEAAPAVEPAVFAEDQEPAPAVELNRRARRAVKEALSRISRLRTKAIQRQEMPEAVQNGNKPRKIPLPITGSPISSPLPTSRWKRKWLSCGAGQFPEWIANALDTDLRDEEIDVREKVQLKGKCKRGTAGCLCRA